MQYLFVFIVGFIGDVIVHYLAKNKILGASLMPYYKSLSKNYYLTIFYGGILGGIACLIALLGSDLILYLIEKID